MTTRTPFPLPSALLLALLLGANTVEAAKLYKWVDENGKTQYSQKPPSATDREAVIKQPEPAPAAEPAELTPIEVPKPTDLAASQRAADRCQTLYHELEVYRGKGQVIDADGNVMVVSPEMREAKVAEIRAELDSACH